MTQRWHVTVTKPRLASVRDGEVATAFNLRYRDATALVELWEHYLTTAPLSVTGRPYVYLGADNGGTWKRRHYGLRYEDGGATIEEVFYSVVAGDYEGWIGCAPFRAPVGLAGETGAQLEAFYATLEADRHD
jgi:hypothetical protein